MKTTLQITEEQSGTRLDSILAAAAGISRSAAARLIAEGHVTLRGRAADKNDRPAAGEELCYELPAPREVETEAQDIPLAIVYEDDDLLVINKPSGMVVHPAAGNEDGTLVNALLYHCKDGLSGINGELRPGIVHRIDKDTSGLLAVAKNDTAHRALAAQLEDHSMRRTYYALVNGGFSQDEGTVDLPIGRHPRDRKKMAVLREGEGHSRRAITHYRVLRRYGKITYLSLQLETGRTHQIRVHMAHLGHPLLGDTVYGGGHTPFEKKHAALLCGQCLHAGELAFVHPTTKEAMVHTCPLPASFERLLAILEEEASC
ncbi:MAG: RluA family pseudouridine synthase [Clostridia bacterium]|nr:RluA family pseudouridine synthase [Clostridia bacterium]